MHCRYCGHPITEEPVQWSGGDWHVMCTVCDKLNHLPASPPISRESVERLRESWQFFADFYDARDERKPAGFARLFMWDLTKLLERRT